MMIEMAFGPMSPEIIESVYRYSSDQDITLMLIASRNQIDYERGYVMDTDEFGETLGEMEHKYPLADVMPCRDHCGYGFAPKEYDTLDSIKETICTDIDNGFQLIHIDLCHSEASYEKQLKETCDLIQFARDEKDDIMIEVGTDENTGDCEFDLSKVKKELCLFQEYEPTFYVAQTGSLVVENYNEDNFKPEELKVLSDLAKFYGTRLKEHNADYLSEDQLAKRIGIVGGVNIAPQLGVVQTTTVLNLCNIYGVDTGRFKKLVQSNGNWKKWMSRVPVLADKLLLAGHYHFASDEYKEIIDQLPDETEELIIENVMKVIEHYERNLYEVSSCRVCF
jgi:hypothetical protein